MGAAQNHPHSARSLPAEIIGIALGSQTRFARLDHVVFDAVLLRESHRFFERLEAQMHLVERVGGARPAHQRVGFARGCGFVFQPPLTGSRLARLHGGLGRAVDHGARHGTENLSSVLLSPNASVVGAARFELAASSSQSWRSTRLSYAPKPWPKSPIRLA